jgi:hypothetical protein
MKKIIVAAMFLGVSGSSAYATQVTGSEKQKLTDEVMSFVDRNYAEVNFSEPEFVANFERDFGVGNFSARDRAVYAALWSDGLAAVHYTRMNDETVVKNAMECVDLGYTSNCKIKVGETCNYSGEYPKYCD